MYKKISAIVIFLSFPLLAHADVFDVLDLGIDFFTQLVPIFVGIAILVFFWGIIKFIANAGDEKAIAEGKQFMIWGMVGLFVIVSFWGIIGFLQESLDIGGSGLPIEGPAIPTSLP